MHLQAMVNEIPDLADQLAASIEQMADHGELHAGLQNRQPVVAETEPANGSDSDIE
jgi:hypothetical protein